MMATPKENMLSPVQLVVRDLLPNIITSFGLKYCDFIKLVDEPAPTYKFPASYRKLARLLRRTAEITECDHLGILLGRAGTTAAFGEMYMEARKSRTVRDALTTLAVLFRSKKCGAVLDLTAGQTACLSYVIVDPEIESCAVISDLALAIASRMLISFCGQEWSAELVELPRRKPANSRLYRRHLGGPVAFDSSVAAIHFDGKWLDRPLAICPAAVSLSPLPLRHLPEGASIDYRVALQLSRSISRGMHITAAGVAQLFGICDRTLQRELLKADSSYRSISADVHFGAAKRLLSDTDLPMTEISLALGYADASVLTRAFTRWAGTCPTDWRARARQLPASADALMA